MTAAASLLPMAALAPSTGSCFSGTNSSMSSRRPTKGALPVQRLESPATQGNLREHPQHWQETSLGMDAADRSLQQPVEGGESAAAATATSVAPLRVYPAQQGTQQHLELLQRGLGIPQPAVRPSLTAKTSSLLQRKQQFYKTKMCPWFSRGRCDRGISCQFAHSTLELRATPDLRRTSLCPRLKQLGRCVNRDCSYAHQPQELRATGEVYKTALCVKWQLGRCAVGNLCRHAHGPEEMRGVVVPAGTSPKKGAADATTAGVAAATAGVASPSGMGRLANPGGRRSDPPEADLSSRSSLGSSSGNTSSSSNSTCTSSPAPCHSPYSFSGASGRGVDSGAAAPAIDGAAKETEHERAVSELQQALPDFGETPRGSHLQQQTDYQAQHQPQSHQQQGFGNYLAGPFALQGGNLGAPWAPEGGAFPLDYPLQPQSAAGWEAQQQQQQQQGRSLGQHGKALMQPRHLPSQKSAALPAPSRKLPKAVQRQMRQQQVQQQQQLQQHQQQLLLLQPQRQARPTSQKDLQQQQQPQNQQLQAGQGGHRRRCTQQQQQQQQNQQLQSQQQLCPWVPRHQRLPWGGVQHQQQQQRHQQPQLPLQGSFHTQAQQHHVPQETMLLLQQQQQQQQANLPLHEGQWEQQEQQHPHPLAQYRPLSDRALTTDPSHPLLQPLQQQQQQTKAASCGPQLPQQQQQQQHTWEPERLLSLWEQADVCCWTGGSGAQEHQDDTAAAVSAAAAFVDAPMSDRLLLLSHQDVEGPGTGALPQQELQLESLEAGGEAAGAGGAAATDGKAQFPPAVSSAATGIPRPVPLQAPDCSRISQTSEESPCSILFSGPKLFNVAADADSQH